MAKTIPCDLCGEHPATFLVTLKLNGDTQGVGLECVSAFGQAIGEAMASEGVPNLDPDLECFTVTLIPDGDQMELTLAGLMSWVEVTVTAIDAAASAAAGGPDVEPIQRPDRPRKARKARKAPSGAQAAAGAVTDEEWEDSGLSGRPPLSDPTAPPVGSGEGLAEDQAETAADGR